MILLSLVFITFYLASIIKGSLFYNTYKASYELEIGKLDGTLTDDELRDKAIKVLIPTLFAVGWIVSLIGYYLHALNIPELKQFTLVMIGLMVVNMVHSITSKKKTENDLEKLEEAKRKLYTVKKRTFKGTVMNILSLVYFCVAFYVLVFQ